MNKQGTNNITNKEQKGVRGFMSDAFFSCRSPKLLNFTGLVGLYCVNINVNARA